MDQSTAEVEPWEDLIRQEQIQAVALRLNVDTADVKPCFARFSPLAQGHRNNNAFIYATELRRMGVAEPLAWADLQRWNRLCSPPLSERELHNTFKSALRGEKTYGCRGQLAALWCVGRKRCDWYGQNVAGRRKCREEDFFDYGWPGLLKSSEFRAYIALVRLEKAKGVGLGGLVIASTRDYAEAGGLYRRHVMESLGGLEARELLLIVERGERRSKGQAGKACHVKRVVPIPEPPVREANERRNALCA